MYGVSFFKRKGLADNTSVPFVYIKKRVGCTVRSVMSQDLRFKHPFTCIISGRSGSGKSSFCIKFLQKLTSLCTDPNSSGGILWCYGERNAVPSHQFASGKGVQFHEGVHENIATREADRL
jgi:hypothetical protein